MIAKPEDHCNTTRWDDTVDALLAFALEHKASDVHIAANAPPFFRVDGELYGLHELEGGGRLVATWPDVGKPLSPETASGLVAALLERGAGATLQDLGERKNIDFAYQLPSGARFRVNAYFDRVSPAAACRALPDRVPEIDELFGDLPGVTDTLKRLASLPYGLVLVTGPTGSGKSTTLAAMVGYVNCRFRKHVITMEDPVEYVHSHGKCLINQREVGRDVLSFADGLRAALREDPDVILVGEMRDLETVEIALHAAKTGHLVLSTLHTSSAAETVERVVSMFPEGKQQAARLDLADALQGVVAQQLVRRKGGGQIPAVEILVATPAVRNLIREGKAHQIATVIQTSRDEGMILMAKSLSDLIRRGLVSEESAEEKVAEKRLLGQYRFY